MNHIDSKFISLISSRLDKFKKVKPNLYNFRCPICGDSKKNKSKARGYIYGAKSDAFYKCHNCGASTTFNKFLKKIDPVVHSQYLMERFKGGFTGKGTIVEEPKFECKRPVFKKKVNLPRCSEIDVASDYLNKRKINPKEFYYAEDFSEFVRSFNIDHDNLYKESRIIIPLYFEKNLIGFQGRSLKSNSIKYITIMLNDDSPKIYGIDQVQKDKNVFVTEGPFDSTFVRNAIAMCGADADVRRWGICNPVWIYDNEPRNREIVNRIRKTIESGDSLVIWPSNIIEKDINDMVVSGHDVQSLIESNIYSGLEALVKFNTWKKI